MSAHDDLYAEAKDLVLTEGKTSTSYLQRRMQIGFNRATALLEAMEMDGILSAPNHVGKREILKVPEQYLTPAALLAAKNAPAADDTPPWETNDAPAQPAAESTSETPAPKPAAPRLPDDGTIYICSGCDTEAEGNAKQLPAGWYEQYSASLGTLHRCPDCAKKNATKIATSTMSTEEIMSGNFAADDVISGAAQSRLRSIIERCQRLKEDMAGIAGDLKEVLDEAKGEGFDVKIIRKLLTYLAKDKAVREEENTVFDLYLTALGES